MAEITYENVEQVFGTKALTDGEKENVGRTITLVEERFVEMAKTIITNVPRCAHRSAALRDLLQAKMMCIDAIAKGGLI